MVSWAKRLGTIGTVVTFDYPYMAERRSRPDPLPQLIAAHRHALASARKTHSDPIVLIGKSMGGRVGCHVALEESVGAVVCMGYPLCGAGDKNKLRDKVLRELTTPILFVQGTRDALCPLDLLEQVRSQMRVRNEIFVVQEGDHSLLVPKRFIKTTGQTQEAIDETILKAIETFVGAR